jgi:CRISPR-associated protein Cas1
MLKGRLGLETARIPHKDRHGLIWLSRGALVVEDGTLRFVRGPGPTVGNPLSEGDYAIPFQMLSVILLGPGSTVSHDALRLCARHGTAIAAVGEDGVRAYTAPPLIPDRSGLARRQARVWADAEGTRLDIARRMYAWRLGEILPHTDIATLRGIEGSRVRQMYKLQAQRFGITWAGRRYDRENPTAADLPNQALNHAASAIQAAAVIAVAATATIPQLGFIHEDAGQSFVLDIADLFRDEITVPAAFAAVVEAAKRPDLGIERVTRRRAGAMLRDRQVIEGMIDRIKQLFGDPEPEAPPSALPPVGGSGP